MPQQAFFDEAGSGPAVFALRSTDQVGRYTLTQRFLYRDPFRGEWQFVVPRDTAHFRTDFASIPRLLTWLVPKDGTHTPAALLHDALVKGGEHAPHYVRVQPDQPPIAREEADNVFRHALRHLGVSFARSWMMWGAVSVNTLTKSTARNYWRFLAFVAVVVFGVGGVGQTLDLFDVGFGDHRPRLRWMGDRPWTEELFNAVVWTIVAGALFCLLWARRWQVGAVAAIALPILGLPLIICAASYLLYKAIEFVIGRIAERFRRRPGSTMPPANPPGASSGQITERPAVPQKREAPQPVTPGP